MKYCSSFSILRKLTCFSTYIYIVYSVKVQCGSINNLIMVFCCIMLFCLLWCACNKCVSRVVACFVYVFGGHLSNLALVLMGVWVLFYQHSSAISVGTLIILIWTISYLLNTVCRWFGSERSHINIIILLICYIFLYKSTSTVVSSRVILQVIIFIVN